MNAISETGLPIAIRGQLLHLSEGHKVAIYSRGGASWAAEFRDGHNQLMDAATWFRFPSGVLLYSHGRRAAALESATALTPEVLAMIEHLHQIHDARDETIRTAVATILESLKRCCSDLASRLNGQAAKSAGRLN